MPILRRSPTRLVYLLSIASPGQVLLVPLLGGTVLVALLFAGVVQTLVRQHGDSDHTLLPVAVVAGVMLAGLLLVDLVLAGALYVFDRRRNVVRVCRGPFPLRRFALSDLVDVEVATANDRQGRTMGRGRLVFRTGEPMPLNSFGTTSVDALQAFQEEVRAFARLQGGRYVT